MSGRKITLCLLVLSADNLYKQFGPISGQNVGPDLGPTFFTLMVFLKEFFEKVDFEKNKQTTKNL